MQDLTAKRTLVKSPPELWSELSESERLARHLDAFGEITITKLEPERTVAWEGERASGTVSIEPSGWGTKVTLTAQIEAEAPASEAAADGQPAAAEGQPAATEDDPEAPAGGQPTAAREDGREATEGQPAATEGEAGAPAGGQPTAAREDGREATEDDPEAPAGGQPTAAREAGREAAAHGQPAATKGEVDPKAVGAGSPRRAGFFARLFGWAPKNEEFPAVSGAEAGDEPPPEPIVAEEAHPAPERPDDDRGAAAVEVARAQAALDDVLEALGSAHHRPFSRG